MPDASAIENTSSSSRACAASGAAATSAATTSASGPAGVPDPSNPITGFQIIPGYVQVRPTNPGESSLPDRLSPDTTSALGAVEKLQKLVKTTVTVLRDGKENEVPLEEIVPGDVVVLAAGSTAAHRF